jgi:hypothetical protein
VSPCDLTRKNVRAERARREQDDLILAKPRRELGGERFVRRRG